jgi:hypothetical protein
MTQIEVKVKLDLPARVELLGCERCGDGHGFEEYVLRMLIGSNEEEVAQRLDISAETVALGDREPVEGRQKDRPVASDQARGLRRDQSQEAAQAVRDADDGPDRAGVAQGAGRGAGPRHGGGQAVPGKTDARSAGGAGRVSRRHRPPATRPGPCTAATCRRLPALARGQSPHLFLRRS